MPEEKIIAEDLYLRDMGLPADILAQATLMRDNMSGFEKTVWKLMGKEGNPWGFLRQIPMRGYFLDFYCVPMMACLEADGPNHLTRGEQDRVRDRVLLEHGIRTLRLTPADVKMWGPLELIKHIHGFVNGDNADAV